MNLFARFTWNWDWIWHNLFFCFFPFELFVHTKLLLFFFIFFQLNASPLSDNKLLFDTSLSSSWRDALNFLTFFFIFFIFIIFIILFLTFNWTYLFFSLLTTVFNPTKLNTKSLQKTLCVPFFSMTLCSSFPSSSLCFGFFNIIFLICSQTIQLSN